MEHILKNRRNIKKNTLIYYRLEGEEYPRCALVKNTRNENLDKISWIYNNRIEQKWILVEQRNIQGQTLLDRLIYINLHETCGVQDIIITEDHSLHKKIVQAYRSMKLKSNQLCDSLFLSANEADKRLKLIGKVNYLKDNSILERDIMKSGELNIDLNLTSEILLSEENQTPTCISIFRERENQYNTENTVNKRESVADKKRKDCETCVNDIFKVSNINLGRLMILVFEILYINYLWFSQATSRDIKEEAQGCLEAMQGVSDRFRIKILMEDRENKVIIPRRQNPRYTFALSTTGVPAIYKGDKQSSKLYNMTTMVMWTMHLMGTESNENGVFEVNSDRQKWRSNVDKKIRSVDVKNIQIDVLQTLLDYLFTSKIDCSGLNLEGLLTLMELLKTYSLNKEYKTAREYAMDKIDQISLNDSREDEEFSIESAMAPGRLQFEKFKRQPREENNLSQSFTCQAILQEEEEISQSFLLTRGLFNTDGPTFSHSSVKEMIKAQNPEVIISDRKGSPIFPMGLMQTEGGVVPYIYDSGSSMTSILAGTEGIAFPTAPVDPGEQEWQQVRGIGGKIGARMVYILVPLIDGSMTKIKALVVENTLQSQTKNLKALSQMLAKQAKEQGYMGAEEEIQLPEYGSKAALMIGRSHEHLAPKPIFTASNGLKLYAGCIEGPRSSGKTRKSQRTLIIGGSLLDESFEEKFSNLWMCIKQPDVVKNVIVEGSKVRCGEWGYQWQDLSLTMDDEAMEMFANQPDMVNMIVHGGNRILGSTSQYTRNVSDIIAEARHYNLTSGETPNFVIQSRRDKIEQCQSYLLQLGLEER